MAQTFPLSVEELTNKLDCLPRNMRIKLTQGNKEYYLEDLIIESQDIVTIKMVPLTNFDDPNDLQQIEEDYLNDQINE